jgi:hypothetical protein
VTSPHTPKPVPLDIEEWHLAPTTYTSQLYASTRRLRGPVHAKGRTATGDATQRLQLEGMDVFRLLEETGESLYNGERVKP